MSPINQQVKEILKFSMPFVGMLAIQKMLQWINVMLLGFLGTKSLAAGALSYSTYLIFIMIGTGTLNSAGIRMAENFGAGQKEDIQLNMAHALYISLGMALVSLWIIVQISTFWIWLGEESDLVIQAEKFLKALVWGLPALFSFSVLREFSAALNQQKLITRISLYAIPINLVFNGLLALFDYSIVSVGYASALTEWTMLMVLFGAIVKHPVLKEYRLKRQILLSKKALQWKRIASLLKIGLPSGLTLSLEVILSAMLTLMMGYWGAVALAAHQIVFQCVTLVYILCAVIN